jgi:phosphatidylglycerophosphatase A
MSSRLRLLRHPWGLLASGFGSGLSPFAPGTVGTASALLVYLLLRPGGWIAVTVAAVSIFALGVLAANWVIREIGIEDPGFVVVDEWVGTWITLLPVLTLWPAVGFAPGVAVECALAFVAFRITDILKPWPASWADRELHGGFGAMADDAIAGIYSALMLCAVPWAATWL